MSRLAHNFLTPAAFAAAGIFCTLRSGAEGSAKPDSRPNSVAWRGLSDRGAVAASRSPAGGGRRGVMLVVDIVRFAWLRARPFGPIAAFPLPAAYPASGAAGEHLRVVALEIATNHGATIAVLIVAWILAWSRARHRSDKA